MGKRKLIAGVAVCFLALQNAAAGIGIKYGGHGWSAGASASEGQVGRFWGGPG